MKAFIKSSFGYCPLVCMVYSRCLNDQINPIHDTALTHFMPLISFDTPENT